MKKYLPVPVKAAEEIAKKYEKSIVIIFTHDPIHGLLHTTTYGRNDQEKMWAAQGGKIAAIALGADMEQVSIYEDKITLIGLFHGVIKDLYGQEIADLVVQRVNSTVRQTKK